MLITSLPDLDGSRCTLTYDEQNHWLRATWTGFVDVWEAQRGAQNYLNQLKKIHCAYLLNDNSPMQGPWFDSLEWVRLVWAPEAARMGLRYVAHVVQANTLHDVLADTLSPLDCEFEMQIFQTVAEAEVWLRQCQAPTVAQAANQLAAAKAAARAENKAF